MRDMNILDMTNSLNASENWTFCFRLCLECEEVVSARPTA